MRSGASSSPAIALLLGSTALTLSLAEVAVRRLRPAAASIIHYPCIYAEDDRFGFRYLPGAVGRVAGHFEIDNLVRINSIGFYDDEPMPPGASELVVLAVGDSFTAALNIPREAVWTAVLERELRSRGFPSADVINLGIDGTGTDVHRDVLRAFIPRFRPQVAVVAFYANDIDDVLHGRFSRECYGGYVLSYQDELQRMVLRGRVDEHLRRRTTRWIFDHSYLVRLVFFVVSRNNLFRLHFVQPTAAELEITEAVKNRRRSGVRGIFRDLLELSRSCDCRLVVVPVPPRRRIDGSLNLLKRWLGDISLEIVDVVPAMKRMLEEDHREPADLFWVNDNHLNAYGNRLFARALAESGLWRPAASSDD